MDKKYWSEPGKPCDSKSQVTRDEKVGLKTLQRILDKTKGHIYYVGISGSPVRRSYSHATVKVDKSRDENRQEPLKHKGLWSDMNVFFQAPTKDAICQAEKNFLQAAIVKAGPERREDQNKGQCLFPWNERRGGGGRLAEEGPYFCYVLRSGV